MARPKRRRCGASSCPSRSQGIAGGWLLAFTFSFDEFVIAWFVSGFNPTLPVSIYAYIVGSADPSLNAMATIIFVLSGAGPARRRTAAHAHFGS